MKRLLFKVHRWLGIVLALFMGLWFFSGLVIVYSSPLNQTRDQQWAHGEILAPEPGWISVGKAWELSSEARREAVRSQRESRRDNADSGEGERNARGSENKGSGDKADGKRETTIAEARLVRHGEVPIWLVEDNRGRRFALSAIDGSLHQTSPEEATKIAKAWLKTASTEEPQVRVAETADRLAIVRNQDGLRPFHRVVVDDFSGSELVISARTGEVIQASTRFERGLYWVGNWLHMFRPLDLAGWGNIRRDALTWVAGIAFVGTLTGLIVGWLRWRPGWLGKQPYDSGRTQPYRAFWFRWHFWSGLIGGLAALLWAFSGFLNNNPWQMFSSANAGREEVSRYQGTGKSDWILNWQPTALGAEQASTVELSWHRLGEEAVLLAHQRDGQRQALSAGRPNFSDQAVKDAILRLAGDAEIRTQSIQNEYDSYYYPRHNRSTYDRPLPVVRAELEDEAGTRVYIDPQDGRLLLKQDRSRRVFRWLFSALHHWDFGWLYFRPIWDTWMVAWCLFGLALSITATVIGWRRLLRSLPLRKEARPQGKPHKQLVTEGRSG